MLLNGILNMDENTLENKPIINNIKVFKQYDNVSGIYGILNKINKKIYIGSTLNLGNRLQRHFSSLCRNKHQNKYLQSCFNKYNVDDFEFLVLSIVKNTQDLRLIEEQFIQIYKSYDPDHGYNIQKKVRKYNKITFSQKHKRRLQKSSTGKKMSPEAKERMSSSKRILYGKKVLQLSKDGVLINQYDSFASASQAMGLVKKSTSIGLCANGHREFAVGFRWKLVDD